LFLIFLCFGAFIFALSTLHKCCYLLFGSLSSSTAMPFRGMLYMLLCSCTFLYGECTGFFFCYTFYGLTTHAAFSSCLLIVTPSTPYFIALLVNTSNLFWGMTFPLFSSFLQLWARCLNFSYCQHSLSLFSSSFALNEARAHFSLSKLLRHWLYSC